MSAIGNKIRKLRINHKMTQQVLANKINTHVTMISKIETGESEGSLPTLRRIAAALNVSISELLSDDQHSTPCCPNPAKPAHALPELDCPESVCCALCPDPCNSRQPCRREQAATTEPGPKPAA